MSLSENHCTTERSLKKDINIPPSILFNFYIPFITHIPINIIPTVPLLSFHASTITMISSIAPSPLIQINCNQYWHNRFYSNAFHPLHHCHDLDKTFLPNTLHLCHVHVQHFTIRWMRLSYLRLYLCHYSVHLNVRSARENLDHHNHFGNPPTNR